MMAKNSKLLIAGGGHSDIPLIVAAKKHGYHVITSGNRPDDLGHAYADEYYREDFSDKGKLLELATHLKISAICACCNDFSALSSAYVAEKMGLEGHDPFDVALTIHHKDRFREFAKQNQIPVPRAFGAVSVDHALEYIDSLTYPVVIKPVDLTGGKGISIVNDKAQAAVSLENAFHISRAKRVVVEEYVQGTRHGFSAFLHNQKVRFYFYDNEHYYKNPFLVAAASTPGKASDSVKQQLCDISENIASKLSLKNGIFHIQYIERDNKPIIIEICRRAPGDLYLRLVEHATGVPYSKWVVQTSAGEDIGNIIEHVEPNGYFTRHCIMASCNGTLKRIVYDSSIKEKIVDEFVWGKQNDRVSDFMTAKFGIIFLKFDSETEMADLTTRLPELIKPIID
jgi:biotin carboxylase